MKKLTILFLLLGHMIFAQQFQGRAIYKTHQKVDVKIKSSGNDAFQKKLKERLKKMYQKTYILNFNQKESTYIQNEELATKTPQAGGVEIVMFDSSNSDVLYKNIAEKRYVTQKDVGGKFFLIQDDLPKDEWQMTGETKKIGKYTCYKATKSKEVTRKSFLHTDGEKEETEKKETVVTTAWYTPEIPVSNGPKLYGGLPGLILEIQAGKQTIVCPEIVLNPKEKVKIKKPKRGKKVTEKEFKEIMDKKTKEMLERFKSRKSKKGDKNSISIEISH